MAASSVMTQKEHPVNIFVGNLAFTVTEQDLRELFAPYGVVDRINLITDRETGRPRGFGFVEMADDKAAQSAMTGLQGKELAGRALNINEARQREERRPPSGPRGGGGERGRGRAFVFALTTATDRIAEVLRNTPHDVLLDGQRIPTAGASP